MLYIYLHLPTFSSQNFCDLTSVWELYAHKLNLSCVQEKFFLLIYEAR
jgi:hypothetical protein